MGIDKKIKDLLYKRELRKEVVLLRKQLNIATNALMSLNDPTCYFSPEVMSIAEKALLEIEKMKGKKDELYWSPDAWK